ncbi:MAG: antibiotic biosynthesis monooxygenase family protein [Cyanobacteria bacterium P01_C01_bin.72]
MSIHTFFNVIRFPEGDDTEALKAWAAIGEFMVKQPGFLGSTLYRNRQDPKMLINKGRYDSVESFLNCVKSEEFNLLSQKLTDLKVERTAGLYDEVKVFGGGGN